MVSVKRLLSILFVVLLLISLSCIGRVFASSNIIRLTNIVINEKTSNVDASIVDYSSNDVDMINNYHELNNYVEYTLTIKNVDSKTYSIKSISDDNTNENVYYEYYDYKDKILRPNAEVNIKIRETYNNELDDLDNRSIANRVNFFFNLVDEEGVEIYTEGDNPFTGDKILLYVGIAAAALLILIILLVIKNKKTKGIKKVGLFIILGLSLIPMLVKADDVDASITFNSNLELRDKVKVTYIVNEEPRETTVKYGSLVTLPNAPSKNGYLFDGWYLNGSQFDSETPVTKDIELVARYKQESYKITYDYDGGNASNPAYYKITELPLVLNNPVKEGYEFIGWTGSNGNNPVKYLTIYDEARDLNYKANYRLIEYDITYEGLTTEEYNSLNNPDTYNITDEVKLNNPTSRLDQDGDVASRFIGWKNDSNDVSKTITLTNETNDKSFEAIWLSVTPEFGITYELNGGTVDGVNPISYTKVTPTFTLINPTKRGYEFDGWIGSNGDVPSKVVTIEQGTRDDLHFEAIFSKINYNITYDLDGGTETVVNPTTYTVTDTITLHNPIKRGYNFIGWSGTDIEGMSDNVTIPVNSIGTRSYKANYEAIEYDIIYHLADGVVSPANPTTYTVEDTFTLNNPVSEGHTFDGWTGSNGNEPELTVTVTNSIGNLEYTANYTGGLYTVHFDKNHSSAVGYMNDELMQVDVAKNLNINTFTRKNYAFDGWSTNPDGTGTQYADGVSATNVGLTGTVTLYAKWKLVKKAVFDTGSKVNIRMKTLSGQSGAGTGTNNTSIKKVKYVDTVPDEYINTDYNIASTSSQYPIYMWYDSSEQIIYYGTLPEVDEIYLGEDASFFFNYLYECTEIDTHFKTDDTINFTQMFWRDVNLEILDVSHFRTNNAKSFASMFGECGKIPSFDLSGWSVNTAKTFSFMFNQCTSITELDLTGWVTESAETFKNMFSSMTNLTTLKIPDFVTGTVTDMQKMFDNSSSLTTLDVSHFNTSKVTAMNQMFENMKSLTSLNVSSFDTSKVKNMEKMFRGTDHLTTLDISSFDTSIVTNMNNMFSEMSALQTIYVSSSFVTTGVTSTPVMFASDTNLVGGRNTVWSSAHTKKDYARIDDPDNQLPGYFTEKN